MSGRISVSRGFLTVATFVCIALLTSLAAANSSAGLMDISADGSLLACSNRDSGTVTIVDLKTNQKRFETKVGHKPEGVSFLGKTHALAVAVYGDDCVQFFDGDSGKILGKTDVLDEPYGVVSDSSGKRIFVTLSYPGKVVEISVVSGPSGASAASDGSTSSGTLTSSGAQPFGLPLKGEVTRTMDAGAFSRGLAIASDDSRLFVTEYYTANVLSIDVASGKITDRWAGVSSDNLSRQIVLHPKRPKAYLSHIRSATERAQGEGSIFPYVSILDTEPAAGDVKRRKRVPMDSFTTTHVTANPWEVCLSPDGTKLFAVFSGTNELFACEVVDDDYREIRYKATLNLGANPRAARVTPDGKRLFVYNALDFNIVSYDMNTLRLLQTIFVTENPLGEEKLLGKKLFYSALQPMVGRRWISCSSCHPDGETDGRTWQNPEGLRDTPALAGLSRTHPLHWSADRDESQDFEHTIRGPLMQGRGLIRGKVNPELGAPNKGLSRELDALSAYTNSHEVALSPHAKQGLSESAKRGKAIFFDKTTQCAACHAGPYYTDSGFVEKSVRHDVGTGSADPTEKMGPAYDTPTLLGVYKTAPYLHHGKAATLEEMLTKFNPENRHGSTSQLSAEQIRDLVEFLKALPYEDPEPEAKRLGMRKVER